MTEYVLSSNLWAYGQCLAGTFSWGKGTGEADQILRFRPGDVIVPKFAQAASYHESDAIERDQYLQALGIEVAGLESGYNAVIQMGKGAVPFLVRVMGIAQEQRIAGRDLVRVPVQLEHLPHPLSTQEFLRLRALPLPVATQFKATVGRGRHIQEVPTGLAEAVRECGRHETRPAELFRRLSLVVAQEASDAARVLAQAGRPPEVGDEAFLATPAALPGLARCSIPGLLHLEYEPIAQSPSGAKQLLLDALSRSEKRDQFAPKEALLACDELQGLLDSGDNFLAIDDYARFYDRYALLLQKVNQALKLSQKPLLATLVSPATDEGDSSSDDYARLAGLTVDAVKAALPPNFSVADESLSAAVAAIRAGRHLLLAGPPGSGKTTLGEAICRAVVGSSYLVSTATADWTTFDTIGGYVPLPDGGLEFAPGVVMRALRDGDWVLLDEINRADIDKSFGPLFTVLSSTGEESVGRRSLLPYQIDGQPVVIEWSTQRQDSSSRYCITPSWRMIGTLNVADKASLFRMSFAFLRRFAVIDVPNPSPDAYRLLIDSWVDTVPSDSRRLVADGVLAAVTGPVEIGPAIASDMIRFIEEGLSPTASGPGAFADPHAAIWASIRVFVVPQYEGRIEEDGASLVARVADALPHSSEQHRAKARSSFNAVSLR